MKITTKKNSTAHDGHCRALENSLEQLLRWVSTSSHEVGNRNYDTNSGITSPGHLVTSPGRVVPRCLSGSDSTPCPQRAQESAQYVLADLEGSTDLLHTSPFLKHTFTLDRPSSTFRSVAIGVSVLTLALACRSGQSGPPSRPEASIPRDQYHIVQAELDAVGRDNLYDAVRQLRPEWFSRRTRNRAGEEAILVYLDDRQMGTVTVMRRFSTHSVQNVRYLGPTEAQVRYGQSNLGRPAIQIELARQP